MRDERAIGAYPVRAIGALAVYASSGSIKPRGRISHAMTPTHPSTTRSRRIHHRRDRSGVRLHRALSQLSAQQSWGELRAPLVKRWARYSAWLCLGLLVTACAHLQARDFQQAVDHLSQAEVVERWGLPESVVAGTEGQTLWIHTAHFHVWQQPGGIVVSHPGWVVPGGERCTQYLLIFDRMQVLRGWSARRC
jgi:hypothetical protein